MCAVYAQVGYGGAVIAMNFFYMARKWVAPKSEKAIHHRPATVFLVVHER